MCSGTTGVACKNLNRNFIEIEKDEKYFKVAQGSLNQVNMKRGCCKCLSGIKFI